VVLSYFRQNTLGRYGKPIPPTVTPFTFPACTAGINAVDSLISMPPDSCIYTYNLMPSEYGMRLRKGYREWATGCVESPPRAANSDVNTIIPFESNVQDVANDRLFAVTAEGIWNVTQFNETTPTQMAVFTQTQEPAGFGVWTEFTGDAAGDGLRGHYLFYADGLNGLWQYEEATDLWTVPPAGILDTELWYIDPTDGVTKLPFPVEDIAFVMVHMQRIWVILEDDDDAYYFPVASISGELTLFTFGSKMPHGGNLVGLWSWTVDAGDGVDDMLVAVSRGGDVIVYQGQDPQIIPDGSSVGPWSTRGVWFIGEVPASRRLTVPYGPDLYVLSTFGLNSLNGLLRGDDIALDSPSKMVNRFLRPDVENGKDSHAWQLVTHPADGFLQIVTPKPTQTDYIQYNMNLQTGAWGFWEGVPALGADSWSGDYYIAGPNGVVYINDGVLDNTELAKPNFFQDVNPVVGVGWTVPVALEFQCDGTQVAETHYQVDATEPLVIGQDYQVFYRIQPTVGDDIAGFHSMLVGATEVIPPKSGVGTFADVFTATAADTTITLVGDTDFEGTFYDVAVRIPSETGSSISFRTLTSFQAPAGHSNFNRVGFIRSIGVLAGIASLSVKAVYDYSLEGTAQPPVSLPSTGDNVWDSAVWDRDLWDFSLEGKSYVQGALGMGRTWAVSTAGSSNTRINIVGWDCLYTTGGFL
jgi:hypothetical protein